MVAPSCQFHLNREATFDRANDLSLSDAQAHNNRGLTRWRLGDHDCARAGFQRALELESGMREVEENLKRVMVQR